MDGDRRRFIGRAAMTMAAVQLGTLGLAEGDDREPRELAAIGSATEWLNSPRLTAASLRGKVVLVDFWTYTCINWLRTLPYVRAWSQKYQQGLVVIGVHTPEFPFEHDLDNVRHAVRQMQVEYPVVIDNDYSIWRAFRNQYWPALYLIDARGRVREHQFGEGEYERSERAIQRRLSEAGVASIGNDIARRGWRLRSRSRLGQPAVARNVRQLPAQRELRFAQQRCLESPARIYGPGSIDTQPMVVHR
jgi:thiol-disulfide isomerase/thioredoxin